MSGSPKRGIVAWEGSQWAEVVGQPGQLLLSFQSLPVCTDHRDLHRGPWAGVSATVLSPPHPSPPLESTFLSPEQISSCLQPHPNTHWGYSQFCVGESLSLVLGLCSAYCQILLCAESLSTYPARFSLGA